MDVGVSSREKLKYINGATKVLCWWKPEHSGSASVSGITRVFPFIHNRVFYSHAYFGISTLYYVCHSTISKKILQECLFLFALQPLMERHRNN